MAAKLLVVLGSHFVLGKQHVKKYHSTFITSPAPINITCDEEQAGVKNAL